MTNTTTPTQRRDRRREMEEKYGLRPTSTQHVTAGSRDPTSIDMESGQSAAHLERISPSLPCSSSLETRQLKSSSSSDEPLLTTNSHQPVSSRPPLRAGRSSTQQPIALEERCTPADQIEWNGRSSMSLFSFRIVASRCSTDQHLQRCMMTINALAFSVL